MGISYTVVSGDQQMQDKDFRVVWSGKDPLLPEREEKSDVRLFTMPSYDLDEDEELVKFVSKRHYVLGKREPK